MVASFDNYTLANLFGSRESFEKAIEQCFDKNTLIESRKKISYSKKISIQEKKYRKSVVEEQLNKCNVLKSPLNGGSPRTRLSAGLTSAQELAQDSSTQDTDLDGDTRHTLKSTNIASTSSASDSQESPTLETLTTPRQEEKLTSSPLPHPASHSPLKENGEDGTTSATAFPQSSESLNNDDQSLFASKMSQDSSPAVEETTGEELLISSAPDTVLNPSLFKAHTLEPPGWVQDSSLLPRPGAMSHTGDCRPPGQTKFETVCKERGLIKQGEVLDPEAGEVLFGLPVGWSDPSVSLPATELIANEEPHWGMPLTPDLPISLSEESSTSPKQVGFHFRECNRAWESPQLLVSERYWNRPLEVERDKFYKCSEVKLEEVGETFQKYADTMARAKKFLVTLGGLQPEIKHAILTPKPGDEHEDMEIPHHKFLGVVKFGEEYTLVNAPGEEPRKVATAKLTACASQLVYEKFVGICNEISACQAELRSLLKELKQTEVIEITEGLQHVEISRIKEDVATQSRQDVNPDVVSEYAQLMGEKVNFPPIILFWDGENFYLGDGWHRYYATKQNKREWIRADVRLGTKRDAILYSCSANKSHGLRMSNADKRKAVTLLLQDEEWKQWSNREIARRCGCNEKMVRRIRDELGARVSEVKCEQGGKVCVKPVMSATPVDSFEDSAVDVTAAKPHLEDIPKPETPKTYTSVKEEQKDKVREFGLREKRDGSLMPEQERNEGVQSESAFVVQAALRNIENNKGSVTPAQYSDMLNLIDFSKLSLQELEGAIARINQVMQMRIKEAS